MTFTLNAEVAAVLAAATEQNGPPPAPPVGDVASRRVALDAMLGYFNNHGERCAGRRLVIAASGGDDARDDRGAARRGRAAVRAALPDGP